MQKTYIVNLKHGIVHWQVFFMADDTDVMHDKWTRALDMVDKIAPTIEDSSEFYKQAIDTIASYGFQRIMR